MALAGFVAALSLYVFLGEFLPRTAAAIERYRTWRQQEARIASVTNWEAEQLRLTTRKRLLQQRFAALYVSLPRSDHMSIILQVLQQSAEAEAVHLKEVRPAERATFANYDEVPFEVKLRGTFHGVGAFVGRIEQSPYVIKVKRLQYQRASPVSAELVADLVLSVIVLKEQGGGV
jgi:type IV pilus assembly protein PilO